jgi:uncharacterized protein (TIGR03083 family)
MFDFATAGPVTEREFGALRTRLAALGDDEWAAPMRCVGWTVGDLVAHLVAAAQGQAEGLRAAAAGGGPVPPLDIPDTRDPAKLQELLEDGASELRDALSGVTPELAEALVPLPFGFVPMMLALQIVPVEYGFHRNDLLEALGEDEPLAPDVALSLIQILPGLLPVLAGGTPVSPPGARPTQPLAYSLRSPSGSVTVAFDGQSWSPVQDDPGACRVEGDDNAIALFAMGRIGAGDSRLTVSDPASAARFKSWFPGP